MTANHASPPQPGRDATATTVVLDLGPAPHGHPALEVHGPLDGDRLEAALDQVAVHHPDTLAWPNVVDHDGASHTLRLPPGAPAAFPWGLLADLLTHPVPGTRTVRSVPPTALQRELLADADAHPGRHVERLTWAWHGPLDLDRFRASWQSVVDRESVLRAAFGDGPDPLLLLHDDVNAEVLWLPEGTVGWPDLVEHDLRRGLDPRLPPALRVTVLGGGAGRGADTPSRVLLTYHHALLDDWSARLLVREFYRAYLAGGRLPGGERRPDIRDYVRWLHHQDLGPARDYWSHSAPRADAVSPVPLTDAPVPPTAAPGSATGRTEVRLDVALAERLTAWAAHWGSTESGVLQALWAVLLYRASGAQGPARVRFGVAVSGRGITLEGAERLPAPLRVPLPLSVEVDPHSTVATLLAEVRDRVLDMAAYEWVSPGQVRDWSTPAPATSAPVPSAAAAAHRSPARGTRDGGPGSPAPAPAAPQDGSLLVFEGGPRPVDDLSAELAAQGVRVGRPEPLGARTAFPVTLVTRHDDDGGLVLTATHDHSPYADATEVLNDSASLLTEMPYLPADSTTVAELLRMLSTAPAAPGSAPAGPPPATPPGTPAEPPLVPLRPATAPGAGTVCLVQTPGLPRTRYERLAEAYRGPEAVTLLRPTADTADGGHTARHPLPDTGPLLVLAAFSGGGTAACERARRVAADGERPPLVVLTGATTDDTTFARMLESVAARAGRPR
ncbi:condensation domain-containing protein [Streptomyces parvulus]|uniref:condensation domain-containing protein n=1 Tax=Streptomyces parvulus TaxID=146923 RepID=UPI001E3B6B5C|nr:condensation domain-containing protein [Streptomyces parvulus]MCC9157493.1 condensation domain-containing protein [Streptomyces parvulus]MCE7691517.1 condensation domain-containing protein [Streptomyces parvulus]